MGKKYLIINAYSRHNIGDYAIAIAIAKAIKESDSSNSVTISADDYKSFKNSPYIDHIVPTLADFQANKYFRIIKLLFVTIWISIKGLFAGSSLFRKFIIKDKLLIAILEAEKVICCGGGYFNLQSLTGLGGFLNKFLMLLVVILFKKEISLAAQSIGPFNNICIKNVFLFCLRYVEKIVVRDSDSLEEMGRIVCKKPQLYPDTVFSLYGMFTPNKKEIKTDNIKIAITVRKWWFPNSDKILGMQRYIYTIVRYINEITKIYSAEVHLVSQVEVGNDNDLEICNIIRGLLPRDLPVVVTSLKGKKLEEVLSYYNFFDLLVGTRMHSLIFSLLVHTPVIAISYEPKTRGLMNMFNLQKLMFNIEDIDLDRLINLTKCVITNKNSYVERIKNSIELTHSRSLEGLKYILTS